MAGNEVDGEECVTWDLALTSEVEALPGETYSNGSGLCYRGGDRGRVSKIELDDGGKVYCHITWYGTGRTSMCLMSEWRKRFNLIEGARELEMTEEVESLPKKSLAQASMYCYKEADHGRVSKIEVDSHGMKQFHITWYATGRTTSVAAAQWPEWFKVSGKTHELALMDEVEVLRGKSLTELGVLYYSEYDRGRVTGLEVDEEDVPRIFVTWYRTGRTSRRAAATWPKRFKLVQEGAELSFAEEVEALPGKSFSDAGLSYYKESDRGRVSRVDKDENGVRRVHVTWYDNGRTCTCSSGSWPEQYKLIGKAVELGPMDEVEALPGTGQLALFVPGDRGVVREVQTDERGSKEIVVRWTRTGKTTTHPASNWPESLRFHGKARTHRPHSPSSPPSSRRNL